MKSKAHFTKILKQLMQRVSSFNLVEMYFRQFAEGDFSRGGGSRHYLHETKFSKKFSGN